jgi:hypothetical protein
MPTASFRLSPWMSDQTAVLEAWGHDRRDALQAGLDGVLALMLGEDAQRSAEQGAVVPLRGEGDTVAALFSDLLEDLMEQVAVHGPIESAALDGVLKRDRDGFVAWGYLSPCGDVPLAVFERAGDVEALAETPDETRLRVTLRRLAKGS